MGLKRNIAILAAGFVTASFSLTAMAADSLVFISMSHAMPERAERLVSEALELANQEAKNQQTRTEFIRIGGISFTDGVSNDGVNTLSFVKVRASSTRALIRTTNQASGEFDIVISVKPDTIFDEDFILQLKEEFKKLYVP